MIERISSSSFQPGAPALAGSAEKAAQDAAGALAGALTHSPIGTPLLQHAEATAAALGQVLGPATPVAQARLEGAILDFGREAKSFAIAHADRGAEAISTAIDDAIEAGRAAAQALPDIALTSHDRAALLFEQAAQTLAPPPGTL
jgi:hypothetical protein